MRQKVIDFDLLMSELEENMPDNWTDSKYELGEQRGYHYAMSIVEDQQTIDRVIHGKWGFKPYGRNGDMKPYCTNCGKYRLGGYWSDHAKCNYCPNCGAKMKKE